ncbi:MAG: adenosine deaminase [Chitinophagaceae bacterium]|jgi:adenosine deaminase|nr:adenosine deaminase [Chitinophagaceae bacterium]
MDFSTFPKIELHLHLDCSLSYEVVQKLAPYVSFEEYRRDFIAPPKCTDLADYITRAIKGFELMQTEEQLRLVTLDLFQQLKQDGVVYAEIRFAPLQHVFQGLTATEVVTIVDAAVGEGIRATGLEGRLLLCTLRHFKEAQSMETVQLVEAFRNRYVVGFDIAADEAGFPIDEHKSAFNYARSKGIPCTAHAGEAKGAESVWETLEHFTPTRIGHGVRSAEDPNLLVHLKAKDIHLEVCPTSNVQTNVFPSLKEHTATTIYDAGVSMSINTDARAISDTTLGKEYDIMLEEFKWTIDHLKHCNFEALRHCFAPETLKEEIKAKLNSAYRHWI